MPENAPPQNPPEPQGGAPVNDDPNDGFVAAMVFFALVACLTTILLIATELHSFYDFTFLILSKP